MTGGQDKPPRRRLAVAWPWIALILLLVPAVWHVIDFESDYDPEFPRVQRTTYSPLPPIAYRLAEPGDTLDHIGLYTASAGIVLAAAGWWVASRKREPADLWPAALGLALMAGWFVANPWPTPDGWHGLNWAAIFQSVTPTRLRLTLAAAWLILAGGVVLAAWRAWPRRRPLIEAAHRRGCLGLLAASAVLIAWRFVEVPGLAPHGYWPRWGLIAGMLAFDSALVRALPALPERWTRRVSLAAAGILGWAALVLGGIGLYWFHRPVERLKEAVPGRIFISAMPTYRGLEIAQNRHHFRTIINLFDEDSDLRSPLWPQELQFVGDHQIRYVRCPGDPKRADAFLDQTLALAQDPDAWPILIHCHGCMDRTPAWLGMYRYLVQGRPLDDVLREIEQHRGYRPKASVTLLYNRSLSRLAPERYASDPTGQQLRRFAGRTQTLFDTSFGAQLEASQTEAQMPPRLSRLDNQKRTIRRP